MAEVFLSEAWIAALANRGTDMPDCPGADLVIQHEIAGAPDGKVRFFLVWENGRLVQAELGKHGEPDVVVQAKAPEALKILNGEMSADVAYMQGRLKVDGQHRKLLIDLRDWRATDEYQSLWADMAALTE